MSDKKGPDLTAQIKSAQRWILTRLGLQPLSRIMETLDALGFETKSGQTPVLSHYHKESYGIRAIFTLPAGIPGREILQQREHLQEQAGASIAFSVSGRLLNLDICTKPLPEKILYEWAPTVQGMAVIPVGQAPKGMIYADLGDIISILIAGLPGQGKTNIIHCILTSLLQQSVDVLVCDFKKLEFGYARKHCVLVTELGAALRALSALNTEMNRRLDLLDASGVAKIQEMKDPPPPVVLIVDELTEMADDDCAHYLNRIARLGRAAGVWLICATQRPSSKAIKDFCETRGLFAASLAFRMRDATNSRMVLESDRAALLPRVKGRAVWQHGDDEQEVQTPFLSVATARSIVSSLPPREVRWLDTASAKRLPA